MPERIYKTNGLVSSEAPKELRMMKKYLLVDGTIAEATDGDIISIQGKSYVYFKGNLYTFKWFF